LFHVKQESMTTNFDVIVVGGGHAGIEAANICAKKGLATLLITSNMDMIGQMSCNPAIGGIAKGNIVREVDALGGLMAKSADAAGIHFKMLNTSKGAAVWGNRAQEDKKAYRNHVQAALFRLQNLSVLQGMVVEVQTKNGRISGILMDSGESITTKALVLSMGTFLNGVAHIGLNSFPCGRLGEPPSIRLTESLNKLGIESGRLKTGTSPRIDGRSVDLLKFSEQPGDDHPWPFSFLAETKPVNRVSCWIGQTTTETHGLIRSNLDRSPLYSGKIKSLGPRYCPSIEDKVVRFGERETHTLFLEPEGIETHEMYLNGLSTSLPFDVQQKLVHSISGLEKARILRPGYGIEYDYFQPLQLRPTLESKIIPGLYFAGQINGTSGYEEAAGQGIIAGINASESILGNPPLILGRETSYIGVLIDDLVTKGTEEPYRMFTARAEYRLLLRQDNADERLMPMAVQRGLVTGDEFERRAAFWEEKRKTIDYLKGVKPAPQDVEKECGEIIHPGINASDLLRRPGVTLDQLVRIIGDISTDREIRIGVEADLKYSGFVEKQTREIIRQKRLESVKLPSTADYTQIEGLLTESAQKLNKSKPETLGQASRIPGVTPADVTVLLAFLGKSGNLPLAN